ncbi:amidase [Natronomonas sp.]|uniref:amidase n=1 Tax=Natronomonas sp. TaxID=2184060 RepID=UPI0026211636|nr:amidase [Natronomonas sp.]
MTDTHEREHERGRAIRRTDVIAHGSRLGIDLSETEAERIAEEVSSGLKGYDRLAANAAEYAPGSDRAAFDVETTRSEPGEHNAFLARFERSGGAGALSGLDVALKDNIAVAGVPMTCGSAVFEDAVPGCDAAVVERLLDAGARLIGKTNMDELAYGPTSETSAFGPTPNPVDTDRVAGGSSSGSAAAVAAGDADAALGTDTGGSVRIPASFCGLVGFKPTWGVVSRFGVVELAYSLDHVGQFAADVSTAASVFDALVGFDQRDGATAAAGRIDRSAAGAVEDPPSIEDLSLAVPAEFFGPHVSDAVGSHVRERIDAMERAGASVASVSVPLFSEAVDVWNAITNVEFATSLRLSGAPLASRGPIDPEWHRAAAAGIGDPARSFGPVVRRKAIEGSHLIEGADARHYVAARNVRRAFTEQFASALEGHDAVVTPTMPVTAPELGEWSPHSYSSAGGDAPPPLAVNTRPADIAGVPAVTVPAGRIDGLPVGIQFACGHYEDAETLAIGAAFERFREGGE